MDYSTFSHDTDEPLIELQEGFEELPAMIAIRNRFIAEADDIAVYTNAFAAHIAMLHRTLPDEMLEQCAMFHVLRGDDETALGPMERFDLEGEDYSIVDFFKTLEQRHD